MSDNTVALVVALVVAFVAGYLVGEWRGHTRGDAFRRRRIDSVNHPIDRGTITVLADRRRS